MKLSFCTNGSMRVLKTWATSGPSGSAFDFDLFVALLGRSRADPRGQPAHGHRVEQFRQPDLRLARTADDRNQLPSATARTISRESSSSVGGLPSKYRSITSSSTSMIDSISGS